MTRINLLGNFIFLCSCLTLVTSVSPHTENVSIASAAVNPSSSGDPLVTPGDSSILAESITASNSGSVCSKGKKKSLCPKSEVLSKCIQAHCRPQKCSEIGQETACPAIAEESCIKGCVCPSGYLRNSKGRCIPEQKCPKAKCRANEEFSNCTQALCRPLHCSQRGLSLACPAVAEGSCKSGCVCQSGYLRTASGDCVLDTQCYGDLVCPDNEMAISSPNNNINQYCPRFEGDKGELKNSSGPVCVCRFNQRRSNENGTCIRTNDCPPFACNGSNEEYRSCPPICPSDNCGQASPTGRCPIYGRILIVLECNPKCRCIKGYWRNNGTCVPYAECPGICPTNERYSTCVQAECRALNCTQKGKSIACPRVLPGSCVKGCVCTEGFLRAANGSCIPEETCPAETCDGQNEVLADCANGCDPTYCPESFKAEQENLASYIAPAVCLRRCRCLPGYRRDVDGNCIPIGECPGICPANEEYSNCTQALCRAQSCEQKGKAIACPGIAEGSCETGCVCSTGFLRNSDGNCVPEEQCSARTCDGQNEVLAECANGCDPIDCPESLQEEQVKLASCQAAAVCLPPNCRCLPDYRRDVDGNCIPIQECPGICPANEEYSNCTQALCRAQTCEQKGQSLPCAAIVEGSCERGCVCANGYLRNSEGSCVPEDACPAPVPQQPQCRRDEVLSCVHQCPPERTCRNRNIAFSCLQQITRCQNKCICKPGLYRNAIGDCVTRKQCEQCDGPNEFFSCGSECDNECSTLAKQNRTNCPIVNVVCNQKCYCEDGFARNNQNECVPVEKCPKTSACGINEEYVNCKKTCPPELNVSQ